jgi:porphyrinogen peroxidase
MSLAPGVAILNRSVTSPSKEDALVDASWARVPIEPQSVNAPLSQSAIFLVVTVGESDAARDAVIGVVADIGALVRAVGFRDLSAHLSCIVGIGRDLWDRLGQTARPLQLHRFSEIRGDRHTAVSTPGDLLFHIRAERADFCFELERLLLDKLGSDVSVEDEVTGFRYFDSRDLLGFVDGTENPTGAAVEHDTIIGDEDPDFAGGSYVVVQKYLHDLDAWATLSVAEQERIIGRTKADNIELEDDGARLSHKGLNTVTGLDGVERDILRDNMPFGRPGQKKFGTYFIGYAADLSTIEAMLKRMFIGSPPGDYDRILDFSTALTGSTYFVPSNELLETLGD